jgi:DNA-binding SARP family transcriptional activator/tetratricopeptide (TPR) repeat protein
MIAVNADPADPLRVEILGPLRAGRGGQPLPLGPPRQQAVLAVLAVRANRVVSRDEIVDAVWGEAPPASAANNVHIYVGALRQILEPGLGQGRESNVLVGNRAGYLLRLEPGELDLAEFEDGLRGAAALAGVGDLGAAVRAWDAALRLWRGTPLVGVTGPVADTQRVRLAELRLTALEDRAEALLALGAAAPLVPELSALVSEHRLRERLRALLMLALSQSGRRVEALQLYADSRQMLVEELGVEPGPQLQQAHRTVLGDPGTTGGDVVPRQLPSPVRLFAGRAAELAALDALLEDEPFGGTVVISTIDGSAGIGKTTLAVRWAHQVRDRFPDGQLYVNLRGFDPSGSVMSAAEAVRRFLDAFAVPPHRIPESLDAQVDLYRSLLADRRILVLLDNARDAGHVRPLLPGSSTALVVVTSRDQLTSLVAAEGAHPLALDVLTEADAWELLRRRLGKDRVDAEPDAVDEIVAKCARLPLALAIVAARAAYHPSFPLASIAAELREAGRRLDVLTGSDAVTDLRAVFSYSCEILSPNAARLFRLLGLHPGPDLTAPAAASLVGLPLARVRPLLTEMTRAHLLTEPAPGRYTSHDLLRVYAADQAHRLDSDEQRHAATRRLLDHYLHTAYAGARQLDPHRDPIPLAGPAPGAVPEPLDDPGQALDWFAAERPNLRALVELAGGAGFDAHVWQLVWTMADFLVRQGHWQEWADVQGAALEATRRLGDVAGQARAHRGLAGAYIELDECDTAYGHLDRALELYHAMGDATGEAHAHYNLAQVCERQQRYAAALDHARQALERYRAVGHGAGAANALNNAGGYHAKLGEYDEALARCTEALALLQEVGDRYGEATAWDNLGQLRHRLGEYGAATASFRRSVELYREAGDRYFEAEALTHLGDAQAGAGDLDDARRSWRDAAVILDELGHPDAAKVRAKLG